VRLPRHHISERRLLIDGEGKALAAYGIQGVPAMMLIDPAVNLVKFGNEAMLAEKLKAKPQR
jgi:hypothetical protein